MAKCVGAVTDWEPKIIELEDTKFIVDDAKIGQSLLSLRLGDLANLALDITNDYISIKQSACNDGDKWDCSQVQEALFKKLQKFNSETLSVMQTVALSNLTLLTKQRYFILYSNGVTENIQQLLQAVGRISELDEKLFIEEQRKLMISEESITIHSLTSIWSATIELLNSLHKPAQVIFKDQDSNQIDDSLINSLEFATLGLLYSRVQMMDMIITSWIQFNRLMRFDDLVQKTPFLCRCHTRVFTNIWQIASKSGACQNLLPDLLSVVDDYQSNPSLTTRSLRRYDVVPHEPRYKSADRASLNYFIIWFLYSLNKVIGESEPMKCLLNQCKETLESSLEVTLEQFVPKSQSSNGKLSPHQEERFKLIFLMINHWFERNPKQHISLVVKTFSFFDQNWLTLGVNYFDKPKFRIENLTIFQLFTKQLNEITPMYTKDGQAAIVDREQSKPTKEEDELNIVWARLLEKAQPKVATPATNQSECSAVK